VGGDIRGAGVVGSVAECCKRCAELPGCGAWSWNEVRGMATSLVPPYRLHTASIQPTKVEHLCSNARSWDEGYAPQSCWLKSSCAGRARDAKVVSGVAKVKLRLGRIVALYHRSSTSYQIH
jgi:hypothetical protein